MVSFRNELDNQVAEKTQSDERLKQDLQHVVIQLHQKFLDIDTAISTLVDVRCKQPDCSANRSKCNGANEPGPVGCRGSAASKERRNPASRNTNPARTSTDSSITRNRNTTQVQRGPETLDRRPEAGFGNET